VGHHEILKPLKKDRHDCPSQLDQDTMIVIDTAILEKEDYITYRELQLELEKTTFFCCHPFLI
jgi:hypothetical protein